MVILGSPNTVSTRQRLPLGWRTQGVVAQASADVQRRFYEAIARLSELESCARELEALRDISTCLSGRSR